MSKTVMMTLPRDVIRESIEEVYLLQWMQDHDIHKWIIAKETGNDGYKHWQIRMQWRGTFNELKAEFPKGHIEEDAQDDYKYERKEGNFYSSDDTVGIHRTRFAELRPNQNRILHHACTDDDRAIYTVVDGKGCSGKSFLTRYLWERGRAFYVPPTCNSAQHIIQHVASGYNGEEFVVVDIPRSTKWTPQLYAAIECIKDGLVYDTRYHTTIRDIYGVKVLVMCNNAPNLSKLSRDRWHLLDAEGAPLS